MRKFKTENKYQAYLIKKIVEYFSPEKCYVMKNTYLQGFPDLSVYFPNLGRFVLLEVKNEEGAVQQPNQEYYINIFNNDKSFATFIYPENEKEVLKLIKTFISN